MTRIEDRLRSALTEAADARTVDVPLMRAELDERLARPRHRSRLLVAAAAAVLLVGGGLVAVQVLRDDSPADSASSGEVDDEFSCPFTEHVDLSGGQDEFLPDLVGRTPAEVAREYDAARWEFVVDGDTARLRLGNEDGTLGSDTRYRRHDGEWHMTTSEACSNGTSVTPGSDPLRLGLHGNRAKPAPEFGADKEPVLVDDRPVYAGSGLVTDHRSLYVAPCGAGLCFATSSQDAIGDRMPMTGRVEILGTMCWFFVPDTLVGRASPYALLVAWDPSGQTTEFTASGPGGTYDGVALTDPSWDGSKVWLALVPTPPAEVKLLARLYDHEGFRPAGPLVDQSHAPVRCD
ncbi:MAG TPA: hypothetical protein VFO49_17895 [Nocardioides sp.]|nr:hypothetical protein [Nocardioides sp.]